MIIKPLFLFKKSAAFIFVIFLFVHSLSFADNQIASQLQKILNDSLANSSTPGAVLLVSSPQIGTIIVVGGVADKGGDIKMNETNNFRIASMSKTFLAVTVLKLVEQGKLNLNAKIGDLLPEYININRIPNGQKVTIKELLQMRSGIPNYVKLEAYTNITTKMHVKKWTPQLLVYLVYDEKPVFEPDKSYEYSNTNYLLLQLIVEKLTGGSLASAIRQQISDPLQLKDTFVETIESNDSNHIKTHGYALQNKKLSDVTYFNDGFGLGDAGMISTAQDLNRFLQALLKDKTLLSTASLQQMLSVQEDYGLGIYQEKVDGERAWSHNGLTSGFQGQYYYFPNKQLSIILLTNDFDTDIIDSLVERTHELINKHTLVNTSVPAN
ncbi:MAG: serine hydrolase domain-containing protein [Legionella sp.]|nr:serine hydrolase domain-containing protein [Legionella sp.]